MEFLNAEKLRSVDQNAFRAQKPYPWINPAGLLTEQAYERLSESLPDISMFRATFDRTRGGGQKSHDRYTLKYSEGLELPAPWAAFLEELRGEAYTRWLTEMLGFRNYRFDYFWFYTPNGCSVSPHCDHKGKIAAHLFYFNSASEWKPEWGGETVILDSKKKIKRKTAPDFAEFDSITSSKAIGNYSLLFARKHNSWHGVQEITCPDGHMRKVFMVSVKYANSFDRFRYSLLH